LSTGIEREAVEALARPGNITELQIPKSLMDEWETSLIVQRFKDLDDVTGVITDERRFSPAVAKILETFIVE
jgi:hypothetical protein